MIPEKMDFSNQKLHIKHIPSNTFKVDFDKNRINNFIDGIDSLKQAIYIILLTPRYKYPIYDWNYGIELDNLIGMPKEYVKIELERRIKDALIQDDRIEDVQNFQFYDLQNQKSSLGVIFTINSIFGVFHTDWGVDLYV